MQLDRVDQQLQAAIRRAALGHADVLSIAGDDDPWPPAVCPLTLAGRSAGLAALGATRRAAGGVTAACCGLAPPRAALSLQVAAYC
jgi:hypothetical protein